MTEIVIHFTELEARNLQDIIETRAEGEGWVGRLLQGDASDRAHATVITAYWKLRAGTESAPMGMAFVEAMKPQVKLATYTAALREIAASEGDTSARRLARTALYEEDYRS